MLVFLGAEYIIYVLTLPCMDPVFESRLLRDP